MSQQRMDPGGRRGAPVENGGFGLLEMIVSMAVIGLLMGGAFGLLFRSQVTFELQQANMDMRQQARVALDMLTAELRMAGFKIDNLPEPITQAGANVLQFVGDIDDSAPGAPCGPAVEDAVNGGAERVTYELQAGTLLRSVDCWDGAAWTVAYSDQAVVRDLAGAQSLFTFFDADDTAIAPGGAELTAAQRASVRLITISMNLLSTENLADGPAPNFGIAGRVQLRNVD
jgi:prepilin-type N-terminal cleavage/methylation domain-containing protein